MHRAKAPDHVTGVFSRSWLGLFLLGVLLLGTYPGSSVSAAASENEEVLNPELMQAQVWALMELQDFKLEGFMRTSRDLYPLIIKTKGRQMVFEFPGKALQIRVMMESGNAGIERRKSAAEKWVKVEGKERLEKILESDASYEDLGLDFLRWGNVQPVKLDSIKTLKAWVYDAKPYETGSYSRVRYWISADYFAFLKVDAFDAGGQTVKRVEVNGVQKVGPGYVIKELQISSLIPGRDLSKSRTYIEIRKAEPGSGL